MNYGMPQVIARGEIWWVQFNPVKGEEIAKVRPAVVISSDALNARQVKVVVPITTWQLDFALYPWVILIEPSSQNGLANLSGADATMVRSLSSSVDRFKGKIGDLEATALDLVVAAVAAVIEFP